MRDVFKRFMVHTVGFEPCTGRDEYAKRQFGELLSFKARVEPERRLVTAPDGAQVTSETFAIIDAPTIEKISPEDRITLPNGTAPRILSASAQYDTDGSLHHHEVYFGGGPA